jgi:hypothetical protein
MKLSPQMSSALAAISESGGLAIPFGGGFWIGKGGETFDFANATQTIYALERRGLLKRLMKRKESWADTYEIVQGGF